MQGTKYPSIETVKDTVKLWAISLRKEFRVVKSSSKEYEVKCVNGDCTWRVHAYKGMYMASTCPHTKSVQLLHHIHVN